jgi:S-adenosylmethionine:tRNA ribosyltransferase-isomerase
MTELFFDYTLPEHLIAQHPCPRRDESRLLVLNRSEQSIAHHIFRDLPHLLRAGDRLVLNDSRVLPARLIGTRVNTGGKWEGLVLQSTPNGAWELLCQTRGYPQIGEQVRTHSGLTLELLDRTPARHWLMRPLADGTPAELLNLHGEIPLPPYIRNGRAANDDRERYQTVYANAVGSVAAPTAGLHFTPDLLTQLDDIGVAHSRVTLHVGLGTFAPVKADDPRQHAIHAEWCAVSAETVAAINTTRASGGRVIAVGTTSTRTLESAARRGALQPFVGETSHYIYPPYQFRVVDGLITNFHLPRTTLLLLVQALSGSELLRRAYAEAIREEYRFFSYGDAMLII